MTKHIFWISSYPKSGNTLVRAIIASLFFSQDGRFQFDQLKHTTQFESRNRLNLIKEINKEDFLNLEVQVPTTSRDIIPTPDIDESAGTTIDLNPAL